MPMTALCVWLLAVALPIQAATYNIKDCFWGQVRMALT